MQPFEYRDDRLYAEGVDLAEIATRFGTPTYVYSRAQIESSWRECDQAFAPDPHLICYSVKANSNLAVLALLAKLGSGFDIVSIGELERVLAVGGAADKIVFAGVGKRDDELRRALAVGIRCFNVESRQELVELNEIAAAMGCTAPVALRVNPDVDAHTHPYIATGLKDNKFGVPMGVAREVYLAAGEMANINPVGIACHIGSQLTDTEPYVAALQRLQALIDDLAAQGIEFKHIDVGGGFGIRYQQERPPGFAAFAAAIRQALAGRDYEIIVAPGRAIVGPAGILLTRLHICKEMEEKNFAIVDAAMNDLIRPALYGAWHEVKPVMLRTDGQLHSYDVVGPVCESGDFLAKDRNLNVIPGDLLAVCSAGAYGFTQSSNYNSRPRAAEVMVAGGQAHEVRRRETLAELYAGESVLPVGSV
jgi:diaminopimelate decarboxylase